MLGGLIITTLVCWVLGFFVNGFTLYQVLLIIPTIMFAVRKWGIHIKAGTITGVEAFFIFFSVVWKLLFSEVSIARLIISIIIRAVFLIVCVYDDTVFVYVNEERKKL